MAKKRYRARVDYGGRTYWVSAETKEDLAVKKALKLRDLEEGVVLLDNKITVKQFADMIIETYKRPSQSDTTHEKYCNRVNHCILKHIGQMKVVDVKPLHCQEVLNKQIGNSTYQINQVNQALRFIFGKAVTEGIIIKNPAADLTKPKGHKHSRRALTEAEQRSFYRVMDQDDRFLLYKFMLFCGCRTLEAVNIEGRDIQVINGQRMLHIRGTKTAASDRYTPIPDFFTIPDTDPFQPVVKNRFGKKLTQENRKLAWKALKRAMNIDMGCKVFRNALVPPFPLADDLVPYCFRHTYATNLCKQGVDIRKAQYLMGHSDIQMTANVYTHVAPEDILDVADLIRQVT